MYTSILWDKYRVESSTTNYIYIYVHIHPLGQVQSRVLNYKLLKKILFELSTMNFTD